MKLILSWISRVFQSRNHSNCWKAFFMSSWNKGHFFYCISHEKTWMKYIFWYFLLFEFSFVKSIMVMFFGPLLQFFDALYCFVCGIPTLPWFGITFSVMLVPLATGSCYHTICIGAWFYVLLMIQAIYLNYPKKVCVQVNLHYCFSLLQLNLSRGMFLVLLQGLGLRPGVIDGAISISAVQVWLLVSINIYWGEFFSFLCS